MTGVREAFFQVRVGLNGGFEVSEKYLRSFTDALHRLRAAVVLLTSIDDEDRSELKFNATAIHVRFPKVWSGGAFAICMPNDCSRRPVTIAGMAGKGLTGGWRGAMAAKPSDWRLMGAVCGTREVDPSTRALYPRR